MATSEENNQPGKLVKTAPAGNSRLAEAQKRAQAMASGRGKAATPKVFFEEAWVELKKTTWPTRDVLIKSTTVVLALVVGVAIWVSLVQVTGGKGLDFLFNQHTK